MINKNTTLRRLSLLLFTLLSCMVLCQEKEVDALLDKAEKSYLKFQEVQQYKYARDANILAKEANYTKGISLSYLHMASSLAYLGLSKESLQFIDKAQSLNYNPNDPLFKVRIKVIKSINYSNQELISQSLQELIAASRILEKEGTPSTQNKLAEIYGNIGNKYFSTGNTVEAQKYYKKIKKIIDKYPQNGLKNLLSGYYRCEANIFMKQNSDSAIHYIQKSYENNLKNKKTVFNDYGMMGDYYYNQNNFKLSIKNYQNALAELRKDSVNYDQDFAVYKKLSVLYDKIGDKEKEKYFQNLYINRQNKVSEQRKKNIDFVFNTILQDKENETRAAQRKYYILISIVVLIIFSLLFFLYRILRKKLKQKEKQITEVTTDLEQKEKVISEKNIETTELKLKVNDSYNEVIEMAKSNSPSFYFRFQEVYPEFQKILSENFPGLRNTELILCAYTFLGFGIKDIAEYTFKSINTIRNRKQNLRKKFNIPTDQDMGIWLRNLTKTD